MCAYLFYLGMWQGHCNSVCADNICNCTSETDGIEDDTNNTLPIEDSELCVASSDSDKAYPQAVLRYSTIKYKLAILPI